MKDQNTTLPVEPATPLPWFTGPTPRYLMMLQEPDGDARREAPITIRSPHHTEEIATVWNYLLPTKANADYIVTAANAYPKLTDRVARLSEALRACRQRASDELSAKTDDWAQALRDIWHTVDAALLAEGNSEA